jgi:hypothetical protein
LANEQQPVPQQEPPAPTPAAGQETRTSGKAIASLVLGIVGFLQIASIITSTLAIIFGVMARNETERDPTLGGRGMATAGLVLGIVGLIAAVILFIVLVG